MRYELKRAQTQIMSVREADEERGRWRDRPVEGQSQRGNGKKREPFSKDSARACEARSYFPPASPAAQGHRTGSTPSPDESPTSRQEPVEESEWQDTCQQQSVTQAKVIVTNVSSRH